MTTRRAQKRRVRARAAKTGESYTAALRHLRASGGAAVSEPGWNTISSERIGVRLSVPSDWAEVAQEPGTWPPVSEWVSVGPPVRGLALYANSTSASHPRRVAEGAAGAARVASHRVEGISDTHLGGRNAARLDLSSPPSWLPDAVSGVWQVRQYYVLSGSDVIVVVLASSAGPADDHLLDAAAGSVEFVEPVKPVMDPLVRYTDRARRVLYLAQVEADSDLVGTEHILVGCVLEGEGVAATVLSMSEVTADAVRGVIAEMKHPDRRTRTDGHTEEAIALIRDIVPQQAVALGHNYVGTEHILLGLLTQPDSRARHVFRRLGIAEGHIRDRLAGVLTGLIDQRVRGQS